MWRRISKLDCKISRRAQSAVKCKNPTPSILTSEFRVFYIYLLSFNLFIFHAFRVLVFQRSGVPEFQHSSLPCFSTSRSPQSMLCNFTYAKGRFRCENNFFTISKPSRVLKNCFYFSKCWLKFIFSTAWACVFCRRSTHMRSRFSALLDTNAGQVIHGSLHIDSLIY